MGCDANFMNYPRRYPFRKIVYLSYNIQPLPITIRTRVRIRSKMSLKHRKTRRLYRITYSSVTATPKFLEGFISRSGLRRNQSAKINNWVSHYSDVIMSAMACLISSVSVVCSIVCSGKDQRKHQTLHVTGLCEGNPLVTGGFPSQRASNVESERLSMWLKE